MWPQRQLRCYGRKRLFPWQGTWRREWASQSYCFLLPQAGQFLSSSLRKPHQIVWFSFSRSCLKQDTKQSQNPSCNRCASPSTLRISHLLSSLSLLPVLWAWLLGHPGGRAEGQQGFLSLPGEQPLGGCASQPRWLALSFPSLGPADLSFPSSFPARVVHVHCYPSRCRAALAVSLGPALGSSLRETLPAWLSVCHLFPDPDTVTAPETASQTGSWDWMVHGVKEHSDGGM